MTQTLLSKKHGKPIDRGLAEALDQSSIDPALPLEIRIELLIGANKELSELMSRTKSNTCQTLPRLDSVPVEDFIAWGARNLSRRARKAITRVLLISKGATREYPFTCRHKLQPTDEQFINLKNAGLITTFHQLQCAASYELLSRLPKCASVTTHEILQGFLKYTEVTTRKLNATPCLQKLSS